MCELPLPAAAPPCADLVRRELGQLRDSVDALAHTVVELRVAVARMQGHAWTWGVLGGAAPAALLLLSRAWP